MNSGGGGVGEALKSNKGPQPVARTFRMTIRQTLRRALQRTAGAVKDALFPKRCLACTNFFHNEQQQADRYNTSIPGAKQLMPLAGWIAGPAVARGQNDICGGQTREIFGHVMAPFLCRECITGFIPIESPKCSKCGIMFKSRQGSDHLCGECIKSPKKFGIARSLGVYENILMRAIHCLKYRGKVQLAYPFGMLLFFTFIRLWDTNRVDVIVPVPLHRKKFKLRGFNPSFLMVKDWARIAEMLNFEGTLMPVAKDGLIRSRWTEPQTGLDRKKRLANIKNAFAIEDSFEISGKRILLVDDVYTTGATANECCRVLLNGGAGHVDVLTLARAM